MEEVKETGDDPRAELARMIYILCKIRDIVSLPAPRNDYHGLEWYRSQVEHVKRYVDKAFCEEAE